MWRLILFLLEVITAYNLGPVVWNRPTQINGILFDTGVTFRVWAPNADSGTAYVVPKGSATNRWQITQMVKNGTDGTFSATVGNAQPGDAYTYRFTYQGGSSFERLDPYAQGIVDIGLNEEFKYYYEYEHGGIKLKSENLGGWQDLWSASLIHDPNFDWGSTSFIRLDKSKLIVYEMHIQTFNAVNGQPGTFATAVNRLDSLAAIGVNAVELLPVATFSGSTSGWGYNPCAPFAVLNALGGYTGLKNFVKEANSRGIAVLLDIVWNHLDAGSNILYRYDGYAGPAGDGIYFYQDDRASTPWGPRPNYDTPQVTQYILDSLTMWINDYHISGFRWDSTVCIRLTGDPCYYGTTNINNGWKLMQRGNDLTHTSPYIGWSVAEDTKEYLDITKATNDSSAGWSGAPGGAGFDDQWEERFYYTLEPGLVLANNSNLDGYGINDMILVLDGEDPHRLMYTENHDKASNQQNGRIPSIVNPGGSASNPSYWALKKSLMGIGITFTCSGVPMLFYGQEFVTYKSFDFPVPPNLDWNLANTNAGVMQYVSDLSKLRLNAGGYSSGLTSSTTTMLKLVNTYTEKVFVYDRYDTTTGNHVIVIANMYQNNYPSFQLNSFPSDGVWYIRFNGDSQKYSSQFGNYGINQTQISISSGMGSIMLPSYAILILTK